MAPMVQLQANIVRSCRQAGILPLPRRTDLVKAVSCRGSNQHDRRKRFNFQYRKGFISLRFRKLLEKADRAVHRAQPAIQAVAQAEEQV